MNWHLHLLIGGHFLYKSIRLLEYRGRFCRLPFLFQLIMRVQPGSVVENNPSFPRVFLRYFPGPRSIAMKLRLGKFLHSRMQFYRDRKILKGIVETRKSSDKKECW